MTRTLKAELRAVDAVDHDRVDTTLLLEDLKRRYRSASAPLEVSFREIVSWVRQGDKFTHLLHPYPAKLLPHIAHFFAHASGLRSTGSYVLDPFAGSGTVALEASLAGATALVADSNPLALLLAKVKTTPYDTEVLVDQAQRLSKRVARLRTAPTVAVVNAHLWYSQDTKLGLERVLRAVMEIEDEDLRDFFRICFSVAARRLSHADPSISVPVRLMPKPRLSGLC
jgi:tRNA G10  N-methylase Trm11